MRKLYDYAEHRRTHNPGLRNSIEQPLGSEFTAAINKNGRKMDSPSWLWKFIISEFTSLRGQGYWWVFF